MCSVGGPEQIDDMAHLIGALTGFGYRVDTRRVYSCGLSMGGQEALVLAGRHPQRNSGRNLRRHRGRRRSTVFSI
jgi:pimeloyl-ACP methyl ester carboxylesterase